MNLIASFSLSRIPIFPVQHNELPGQIVFIDVSVD